jgi:hypothetical protein
MSAGTTIQQHEQAMTSASEIPIENYPLIPRSTRFTFS